MTTYEQSLPLPEQEPSVEMAREELNKFVCNPALDKFAYLYYTRLRSYLMPPLYFTDEFLLRERLKDAQALAATNWDRRNGAERQATNFSSQAEPGREEPSDWQAFLKKRKEYLEQQLNDPSSQEWHTVFEAATELGQVESSKPVNQHPDYLVILGGANKAPDNRLRYGLESIEDFGTLVYLGSSRPVSEKERAKADNYLPEQYKSKKQLTEFDLGCAAFEMRLPQAKLISHNETVRNGDTWAWREYEFTHNGQPKTAFALNTPIEIYDDAEGGQKRRATTYDNYQFFAVQAELDKDPNASVVAVTTGLYVPGQHLPAVQELTLPYGVTVETIGHSAEWAGGQRLPKELLQEAKAGIDAAVRLHDAIATMTHGETITIKLDAAGEVRRLLGEFERQEYQHEIKVEAVREAWRQAAETQRRFSDRMKELGEAVIASYAWREEARRRDPEGMKELSRRADGWGGPAEDRLLRDIAITQSLLQSENPTPEDVILELRNTAKKFGYGLGTSHRQLIENILQRTDTPLMPLRPHSPLENGH